MAIRPHIFALLTAAAVLALAGPVARAENFAAQMGAGYSGMRLALDRQQLEFLNMRQQSTALQEGISSVTDSLIEANLALKKLAQRNLELQKDNEALGLSRVTDDTKILEERLLKAVSDLNLIDQKYQETHKQLMGLVSASQDYFSAPETMRRDEWVRLNRAIRDGAALLDQETQNAVTGSNALAAAGDVRVVDVNDKLAVVVINAGTRQGVEEGMQFIVKQGGRRIGTVRSFDVRDTIAGCIIQDFESANTPMEVGQQVMLDVR